MEEAVCSYFKYGYCKSKKTVGITISRNSVSKDHVANILNFATKGSQRCAKEHCQKISVGMGTSVPTVTPSKPHLFRKLLKK